MDIKSYSPESVEIYINGQKVRPHGVAQGDFFEVTNSAISVKFHIASETLKEWDNLVGESIVLGIEIPVKEEFQTYYYKYRVSGILHRRIVGGTTLPIVEMICIGVVEKI